MRIGSGDATQAAVAAARPTTRPARDLGIDRFRGVLVFLMVAGNYLGGVQAVPDLIKHTPDVGLSVADVVAPCFVLAIGLNYGPSFRRRAQQSLGGAYRHFLFRYLSLIGIGAIISAGGTQIAGEPSSWGVLQALGLAGLVCLPVVRLGPYLRLAVGLALLIVYQLIVDAWLLDSVLATVQGGFVAGLSWGALLILSTAFADLWRRGWAAAIVCCAAFAVVGGLAALLVPVSKNRVSLSYILVTLAIGAIVFLLTEVISRTLARRPGYLAWWGENPLALYLLHLLVLALVVLPGVPWWYEQAPLWLAALQLAGILTLMSFAAWWLHRRRVRIEL